MSAAAENASRVVHTIDPVFDGSSRVLILGSMPSPASRAVGFYFGHPRNRFWPVLAAVFDEDLADDACSRRRFALEHGIALWDVLASCTICGAADATISDEVPNDLGRILRRARIEAIFTTGSAAHALYRKHCEGIWGIAAQRLPSTSPANAAWSFDRLVESYKCIRHTLENIGSARSGGQA